MQEVHYFLRKKRLCISPTFHGCLSLSILPLPRYNPDLNGSETGQLTVNEKACFVGKSVGENLWMMQVFCFLHVSFLLMYATLGLKCVYQMECFHVELMQNKTRPLESPTISSFSDINGLVQLEVAKERCLAQMHTSWRHVHTTQLPFDVVS